MPYRRWWCCCCCCYFSSHFHSKSIQLNELEMKTEFNKISTQRRHVYYVYRHIGCAIMMIMFVEQQQKKQYAKLLRRSSTGINAWAALCCSTFFLAPWASDPFRVILKRTLFVELFWHTTMPCMQYSNVFHRTWLHILCDVPKSKRPFSFGLGSPMKLEWREQKVQNQCTKTDLFQ